MTTENIFGLVKDFTSVKCKFILTKAKDLATTTVLVLGTKRLVLTQDKDTMVMYGPGKTVFGTPLHSSVAFIMVPNDAIVTLETIVLYHLDPKCHEETREAIGAL
ncbi:diacylglycerol kinase iota [Platysternon megacephalum]|uniref:Diacylglycerol kinase iota n=1 Tax=Platysternon megacephalum TaxID=55544 RepID=A0A4D9E9Q6_9SAUR|nr:diacylglycerol kinase iota [Platysternon megacephalum]